MNISLSDDLKLFVDQQVAEKSFSSTSEYLRELIRRQRDAEQLRQMLLDGINSGPAVPADENLFAELRELALAEGT
jgi:antitoxin ParD1/3/4